MSKKNLLLIAMLSIFVPTGLLFSGVIISLLEGMIFLGWRFWLSVKAIDQELIWGFFSLVVATYLVSRTVIALRSLLEPPIKTSGRLTQSTVEKWLADVKYATHPRHEYARWLLAGNLFSLYAQLFHERRGINKTRFKRMLDSSEVALPTPVKRYLLAGQKPFASIQQYTRFSSKSGSNPLDVDLELVISNLEEFFEHDT